MRYREGQEPDTHYAYGKATHDAVDFSMVLGVAIGLILLWMAYKGGILWLKVWSAGLILLAVFFLGQRYLL